LETSEKLKNSMKIQRKTEIFIILLLIGGVGDTHTKQSSPRSPALNMNSCDNFCLILVKKVF